MYFVWCFRKEENLMRSRFVRFLVVGFVTGIALLSLSLGVLIQKGDVKAVPPAHADGSIDPVGQWNLTVTFTATGAQQPSTLKFGKNGSLVNYTPGPGTGTWWMTSSNQFQYTFTEKILDNQGNQIAYVYVQQQATLSADGTTYTASGQGTVYAMDGTVLAVNQTTTQATAS